VVSSNRKILRQVGARRRVVVDGKPLRRGMPVTELRQAAATAREA
jgi:hypothetical protein